MSLPKEPRQLMINLMYLVLTAMLALNVSSEILHAFKTINRSIKSSNSAIEQKNNQLYDAFNENENQEGQKARVKPFNDRAKQIKAASAEMVSYLEEWKDKVIQQAGGYDDEGEIKNESDIDASTKLLVEDKGGEELKQKLTDLRNMMLNAIENPAQRASLEKEMQIKIIEAEKNENNPQGDWSMAYFNKMPTMAAVTLLSKFQNDIRSSEAMVVQRLFDGAGAEQIKFDAFQAIAIPTPAYALEGQKITAKVFMSAYNRHVKPNVSYSTGQETRVDSGISHWETTATGVGLKTVSGKVSIDLGGRVEERDYSFEYMVGSTGASIQLDKMNVFYIGVPNPITVSAAGYSLEDISVNIPGATVTENTSAGKGHYIVNVTKAGKVPADIMAKTDNGPKKVGGLEIRVKYIPDPVAKIGGKTGGGLLTNVFKAQSGVVAELEAFDFEARFVVTEFEFSLLPKRGEILGPFPVKSAYLKGPRGNKQVEDLINRAKPGDKVFVEEIKGIGPDKRQRKLNSITLRLM
ncbi:MAG: gliding motility protein GldM [Flavipsychrobacter sp.]